MTERGMSMGVQRDAYKKPTDYITLFTALGAIVLPTIWNAFIQGNQIKTLNQRITNISNQIEVSANGSQLQAAGVAEGDVIHSPPR